MSTTTRSLTVGMALLLSGLFLTTAVNLTTPRTVRAAPGVRYAAPTAQGSGDCSLWANACTLQTALAQAISGDEIWVKAGAHYPGAAGILTATFTLKNGVALYGGFAGTETLRNQRNWQTNKTILSGDIDRNDVNNDGNYIAETWNDIKGNNAYDVVTGSGTDATAVLDGFVITAGQTNYYGGGMYNESGSPTLTHVTFSGNSTSYYGGGMGNYANSSPTLTNVTFSGNSAGWGGGMYNYGNSSPTLTNVIIWGNTAPTGQSIYNESSTPIIAYSDLQGCGGSGGGWDPACGTDGNGNIDADPRFVDAANGNLRLDFGSPAIDAGDPANCPATDQRGFLRNDLRCDIGAYELQYSDSHTVIKTGLTTGVPYSFGPTRLRLTITSGNAGTITVTKRFAAPGGVYNTGEITATWWITASGSPFAATVAFCYTPDEIAGLSETHLRAFRWNGSAWEARGGVVDGGCVTVVGVTAFSAWTLFDTSKGSTPTATRLVGMAARGFAPVAALPLAGLLAFGRAAAFFRRQRKSSGGTNQAKGVQPNLRYSTDNENFNRESRESSLIF